LGFVPGKEKFNGEFHKLKVTVSAPGKFNVQARPGHFAPANQAPELASHPTADEKIDTEVTGNEERSDFALIVSAKPASDRKGSRGINVQAHVDISKLPFEKQNDREAEILTFVDALYDEQGRFVTGKEAQMQFALKQESFRRFSKSGINGGMLLEAPPGKYRLRVVVEEAVKGEMSATSQEVQNQ
jgi:hypothetical protein